MAESAYQASVNVLVPFHDVDVMEVVWHGHYAKYFEIARCALLDTIDYNYPQMRDSGYAWPVIDLRIRYIKPATFGKVITVNAAIAEWENRLKIDYLITDKHTGARFAKGHTIQVAVDMKTNAMLFESPAILLVKMGLMGGIKAD
jgi:acyl-CoA thioester hydrolase